MPDFQKVDDYHHYLLGDMPINNDIMKFISNYFKVNAPDGLQDNLQFALVETTLRNNRQHIGEAMLFGGSPYHGKEVLEKYEKIILSMSAKHKFSPADLEAWYQQDGCYMKSDSNPSPRTLHQRPKWHTDRGITPKDKTQHKKPKKNIKEEDILAYLNEYGDLLLSELRLDDYPHYCIIVKPLSLKKQEVDEYLSIGNLYLFFCTKYPHTEAFYAGLVNYLVLVWLNSNWQKLLIELKEREEQISQFMPNLKPGILKVFKTTLVNGNTLERYYELFFENKKQPAEIEKQYKNVTDLAFSYFENEYKRGEHWSSQLIQSVSNGGKRSLTIETFELELQHILCMRMFAMIATHIYALPLPNLSILFIKGYTTDLQMPNDTAIIDYLHSQRWLMPGSNKKLNRQDQQPLFDHMLHALSLHEKMVLKKEINRKIGTFKTGEDTHSACQKLLDKLQKIVPEKSD